MENEEKKNIFSIKNFMKPKEEQIISRAPLKIIPIGGTTTVQKNMYIYECGNDIIVMDCGIGFPDADTPGVDVILPDFSYILENKHKVKAVVITHGHNDHISSLPYLLREYPFTVYAVPFVKDLIIKSLDDHKDIKQVDIKTFSPDQAFQLGVFRLHPFRVNHSIPDTMGFAIDTPQGRVFHNADYKFDWSPFLGKPFDVQQAAYLAREPKYGVLALLSDCLGSTHDGFANSEKVIGSIFEDIFEKSEGRQLFLTTVSSNVSRIQQAINVAVKHKRRIVLSGRSIRESVEVAKRHGYITAPEALFVDEKDAMKHHQDKLLYVISGSYGQSNASLYRVLRSEHKFIEFKKNPVVVFSADPIPSSLTAINTMVDELFLAGVEVYYSEIQDNLHVSGHGGRGDMALLANIVKPKYFIPIGGDIKHMKAYANLMKDLGFPYENVLQLLDGQAVIFENGKVRMGERLKLKEVYVDGTLVGDVGATVLEDRIRMSSDGMIVILKSNNNVEIVTRGFIFPKASAELIKETKEIVRKSDGSAQTLERKLERFFFKKTGREPIVIIHEMGQKPQNANNKQGDKNNKPMPKVGNDNYKGPRKFNKQEDNTNTTDDLGTEKPNHLPEMPQPEPTTAE
jgi:ribonuclease J